jgi:hypothetical protein
VKKIIGRKGTSPEKAKSTQPEIAKPAKAKPSFGKRSAADRWKTHKKSA